MKKFLIVVVIVLALVLHITVSTPLGDDDEEENNGDEVPMTEELSPRRSEFVGRVLYSQKKNKTRRLTCNNFPRICRAKGSPGPFCCKKKCINLLRDRHNCGWCAWKCKYNEIYCNGKCVSPSFSRRHYGGCNDQCSNGGFCAFGLCYYA